MKLFVWDQFTPDYWDGLAFAVTETIQQAQDTVATHLGYYPVKWGPAQELDLLNPIAFAVPGGA